ncbi:hypothetical protein FOXG_18491 [Fusarium oxysporum f. sp. lycopersici 4287]|uniref:Uncharacterized protein n=1 Tax=Fusarium oxysporum f. sp. lycopersici (strain 4287 / CBS 123668 / FGSC 9935 / NRRL 34936) TaxID=426428 RepID=A0A0J9UIJ6_FUSO4|nr:hypothetical protein FOXG_18491 [Fusarium oxysporum f. sp. lycopersici 4287]XP_018237061.1 hypothetical protein FOXG_18491 [Fusarium oxysporum f. sp. lycopersici 4287]KNA99014.1 hypothetical protein FOXG_18491 [Fusarium oxysporum f. sp. lycopersici 4287]KNA99015.1 hypothetical protein FOXG_18491 [Fusarium oxysporum f. sp. lycopersici 4287]
MFVLFIVVPSSFIQRWRLVGVSSGVQSLLDAGSCQKLSREVRLLVTVLRLVFAQSLAVLHFVRPTVHSNDAKMKTTLLCQVPVAVRSIINGFVEVNKKQDRVIPLFGTWATY